MIYNPEKNYLFVHIQKTGGSSISDCLTSQFGGRYITPAHIHLRYVRFTEARPFIFAVVRNPWERLASWYEMMRRKQIHNDFSRYLLTPSSSQNSVTFSDFIRRTAVVKETNLPESSFSLTKRIVLERDSGYQKSLSFNQIDYLTDASGLCCFDKVIHFHSLNEEFTALMRRFHGESPDFELKKLNANPSRASYRDFYSSQEDVDYVGNLYKRDVDRFHFRFDDCS